MIAACPECRTQYRVDAQQLSNEGVRLRCTHCQTIFRVRAPQAAPVEPPAPAPAPREAQPEAPRPTATAEAPRPQADADASQPDVQPPPSAPAEPTPLSERLVLVATPDAEYAKAWSEAVRGWGLEVETAHDGVEAILKVHRRWPAAVVLDPQLPKMFGFQVCEVIKRNDTLRRIGVVLIGAIHHPQRYRRSPTELYGADAYVEEPDMPEALAPILRGLGLPLGPAASAPSATPPAADAPTVPPPIPPEATLPPTPPREAAAPSPAVAAPPPVPPALEATPAMPEATPAAPEATRPPVEATPEVSRPPLEAAPEPSSPPVPTPEVSLPAAPPASPEASLSPAPAASLRLSPEASLPPASLASPEASQPAPLVSPEGSPLSAPPVAAPPPSSAEAGPAIGSPEYDVVDPDALPAAEAVLAAEPEPAAVAPSAPRESAPAPAPAPAADPEVEQAERLARIIISDVVLYNEEKFRAACEAGNVLEALEADMADGRAHFASRVPEHVRNTRDFLADELMRVARSRGLT